VDERPLARGVPRVALRLDGWMFRRILMVPIRSGWSSFQNHNIIVGGIVAETNNSHQLRSVQLPTLRKAIEARAIQTPIRYQRNRGEGMRSSWGAHGRRCRGPVNMNHCDAAGRACLSHVAHPTGREPGTCSHPNIAISARDVQ
jgi:hypothetical protein